MTETSFYWGGTTIGDATLAPYSDDEFSDIWRKLFTYDRTVQGVLRNYANELAVSGTSTPIVVATGGALVDGKFYENDAALSVVVPTPAADTRIDRIVLRKDFVAQTVRVYRIAGAEGGAAPALTQVDGTTWDIPLAQISITVGGVITVTDERYFLSSNMDQAYRYTLLPIRLAMPLFSGYDGSAREAVESSDAGTVKPIEFHVNYNNTAENGVIWDDLEIEYSFSSLSLKIRGTMSDANVSKNIVLIVQVAAISDGDGSVSAKAFDADNTFTIAVPDTADEEFVTTLALTNIDDAVLGDRAIIAIWRDHDHASDDAAGTFMLSASPRLLYL